MEYIEGERIDLYCDANRLSIDERLQLFREVCAAVQVAHQNLVVHRDIKPGNILITSDGQAKLLDFGIAKLLNPEMSVGALDPTMLELRMMTPEFASPEQMEGKVITTASDVYSLGVLLYELLTGHRAHRIGDRPLYEMQQLIRDTETTAPSTVVDLTERSNSPDGGELTLTPEIIAEARATTPDRLRRRLSGDLDNIVLKAMRKEPHRRYASVEQFADDIRRHLVGLPVTARKDTFRYRAAKFVERHKLPVALGAMSVLFAVVFLGVMVVQSSRLAHQRDLAESEARKAAVINDFLQEMLATADPLEGIGREATVLEALDGAVPRIGQSFAGQPDIEAAARHTIGLTFLRLDRYEKAEPLLRAALDLRRRTLGPEHPDVAQSLDSVGRLMHATGDLEAAGSLYRQALEIRRRLLGAEHADVATSLDNLATQLHDTSQLVEAERLYRQALEMRQRLLGPEHPDIASSLDNLANLLHDRDELDAADAMYREGLQMRQRLLGDKHPDIASSINNIAAILHDRDELEAAEGLYRESLTMTRELLGDEHLDVASGLNNLAALLHDREELDAAEGLYRESLAITRKLVREPNRDVAGSLNNFAVLLHDKGELEEAERLYRESLAMIREVLDGQHPLLAESLGGLAFFYLERGDAEIAEPLFREAVEIARAVFEPDDWRLALTESEYGACLSELGRYAAAEELLLSGFQVLEGSLGRQDRLTLRAAERLVDLYEAWGKNEQAARYAVLLKADGVSRAEVRRGAQTPES